MPPSEGPAEVAPALMLVEGDASAVALTVAIRSGDLDGLRGLLAERPELARARMIGRKGIEGGWRTPLHVAADWPGYFPGAPEAAALLVQAGADPNDDNGAERPETPLHWAASTDDADVAVVLIDAGADLEVPGGSIGTPLDNAVGYACWHVARLLVARGAKVDKIWHSAALGMLSRTAELVEAGSGSAEQISQAFWHASAAGQRRAAEYLLDRGAELNWVPDYASGTPLDAAMMRGTRQEKVIGWLRERRGPLRSGGLGSSKMNEATRCPKL